MNKRWPYHHSSHTNVRRKKPYPFKLVEEPQIYERGKQTMLEAIVDLIKSSTVVQGLVTAAVVGTSCYLWVSGQEVPQALLSLDGLVVGFFFGAKVMYMSAKR